MYDISHLFDGINYKLLPGKRYPDKAPSLFVDGKDLLSEKLKKLNVKYEDITSQEIKRYG